jgi:hypothetical protein
MAEFQHPAPREARHGRQIEGQSLLDLVVFLRASRRAFRAAAAVVALAGVVAAVMAPIVMTEKPNDMGNQMPMMP